MRMYDSVTVKNLLHTGRKSQPFLIRCTTYPRLILLCNRSGGMQVSGVVENTTRNDKHKMRD